MKYQPGETAPKSGEYKVIDANGRVMGKASVQKGQTLPPTQSSSHHFEIN